jgi:hypothetical protein
MATLARQQKTVCFLIYALYEEKPLSLGGLDVGITYMDLSWNYICK